MTEYLVADSIQDGAATTTPLVAPPPAGFTSSIFGDSLALRSSRSSKYNSGPSHIVEIATQQYEIMLGIKYFYDEANQH